MDLYYDGNKVSSIPIDATLTVGGLKKIINDWLIPQGIKDYSIKLVFNNGEEIAPVVFNTNNYDTVKFQAYSELLLGSSLYVTNLQHTLTNMSNDSKYVLAQKLSGKDLINLCATDTNMRKICTDTRYDSIWKQKLKEDFGHDGFIGKTPYENYIHFLKNVWVVTTQNDGDDDLYMSVYKNRDDAIEDVYTNADGELTYPVIKSFLNSGNGYEYIKLTGRKITLVGTPIELNKLTYKKKYEQKLRQLAMMIYSDRKNQDEFLTNFNRVIEDNIDDNIGEGEKFKYNDVRDSLLQLIPNNVDRNKINNFMEKLLTDSTFIDN